MDVPEIDIDELAARLDDGRYVLDVRNPDEWVEARIPGVTLIPMEELSERVDEIPTDVTVPVVCRSGNRSHHASAWLRERGIDAVNVAGGTLAWIDAGRAVDSGPAPS